jgi:hypothetical protein
MHVALFKAQGALHWVCCNTQAHHQHSIQRQVANPLIFAVMQGQLQLQVEQLETAAQAAAAEAVAERARADAAAAEAADLRATLAALQQTNSGGAAAADAQGAAAGHAAGPGTHSMAAGASMGQGTGQQQGGMSPAVQLIAQLQALVQKQQDSAAAHHQPLSNLQVLEPGQQGIDAPGQVSQGMMQVYKHATPPLSSACQHPRLHDHFALCRSQAAQGCPWRGPAAPTALPAA